MATVPLVAEHYEAIVSHVTALAQGFAVGDGEKPDGTAGGPYVVLYLPPGGSLDGPVSDPEADLELVVQATCVGRSPGEALWVRDRVTRILRNHPIQIPGRAVIRVRATGPAGVTRDDDHQPPLFYGTPLYRITTSPA